MKNMDWNDLRIFLHVADTGGLSGAARRLNSSAPTIGRRMLALEESAGQSLFHRSQTGYTLTAQGEVLLKRVRGMNAAAKPVEDLLNSAKERPVLRLSAGTGTAMFLADKFSQLTTASDTFRLHIVTTEAVLDIAHREADLGIRNRPAKTGNLASRRLGLVRFAPFRNWSAQSPDTLDWVALDPGSARHPASHWVHEQGHNVCAFASSVATLHQLIRAGAGVGIMPCMIGDCDPSLARAGPVIEDLSEHQHLVMQNDDRHRPPIRRLIDRIVRVYQSNAHLLSGDRALRDVEP